MAEFLGIRFDGWGKPKPVDYGVPPARVEFLRGLGRTGLYYAVTPSAEMKPGEDGPYDPCAFQRPDGRWVLHVFTSLPLVEAYCAELRRGGRRDVTALVMAMIDCLLEDWAPQMDVYVDTGTPAATEITARDIRALRVLLHR